MLWVKAFHIGFVIAWFAGLFYLPRLFVNLALVGPQGSERERLLLMATKLYRFMTPLGALALLFGLWLWLGYGIGRGALWMHLKLLLVLLLVGYHLACGAALRRLAAGSDTRSHVWYRVFNEAPVLVMFATVILVVVKPF